MCALLTQQPAAGRSDQHRLAVGFRDWWLVATVVRELSVSCLQVDMFTGESAVLVSLQRLFETVLQGPQAGAPLH